MLESGIRAIITYLRLLTGKGAARPGKGNPVQGEPLFLEMDFPPQRLSVSPPAQDWPSYNGDYTGRRYSALDQIPPDKVRRLRVQWLFHSTNSESLEVTPVVVDGLMYVTSANDAFALDARTGRVVWSHTRPLSKGLIDDAATHHNRGVAVWHTRVFMETDNAH